jgi:hypothetical protein
MATHPAAAHVCFGDPDDHLPVLEELARSQGADEWTVNREARGGDLALFYLMRPLSAFVAWGVVQRDAARQTRGRWRGFYIADVAGVQMLARPVPRRELCERFPEWGYLRYPRHSVRVPERFVGPLLRYLGVAER